jgi:predicted cobalt transporter CbtA
MVGKLLVRGMLAGVVAGLVTFGFAKIAGEPRVDQAISFEEHAAAARGEAPEPELVSRATQAGLGLLTGVVSYGVVFVAVIAAVQIALPTINEVPSSFPATLLWQFRLAAIGMQAILWTTIGLLFGALAERCLPAARDHAAHVRVSPAFMANGRL